MAQSHTDDPVDTCRIALDAALKRGYGFCDTETARIEVFGQIVGLNDDDADFDPEEALTEGPGSGSADLQTRQWVVARAMEIIDADEESPLDAINQAWGEVSDRLDSHGDDDDDDEEAEEAEVEDDDDEPEAEDVEVEETEPDDDLAEAIEDVDADEIVEELAEEAEEATEDEADAEEPPEA